LLEWACEVYPSGIAVLVALLTYDGSGGGMWPCADTVARIVHRTERAVRRSLAKYVDAGILAAERRRFKTTKYRVASADVRAQRFAGHESPQSTDTRVHSRRTRVADEEIPEVVHEEVRPPEGAPPGLTQPAPADVKVEPDRRLPTGRLRRTKTEQDERCGRLIGYYRDQLLAVRETKAQVSTADAHELRRLLGDYCDDELRRAIDAYISDDWPRAVGWALVNLRKRIPGYLAKSASAVTVQPDLRRRISKMWEGQEGGEVKS
jgi:hypothetical protein